MSGAPSFVRGPAGSGVPVRRCPHEPGVPIEYVALSAAADPGAPDAGRDAGFEAGYAKGLETARREARDEEHRARARLEQALAALGDASRGAASAFAERADQLEGSVTRFAFELVETLFGRELALTTHPGRDAVARALATDVSRLPATVRLHPDDANALSDLGANEGALAGTREVTVVADSSVAPGGALVEIGDATIDSQLTTALQRVREILLWPKDEADADHDVHEPARDVTG